MLDLKTATRQEVFDFVLEAVTNQGRPSMRGNKCKYRGSNNTKCAIGHLIPDEEYSEEMDIGNWFLDDILTVLHAPNQGRDFFHMLQKAHDEAAHYIIKMKVDEARGDSERFLSIYKDNMGLVAQRYDLKMKEAPHD